MFLAADHYLCGGIIFGDKARIIDVGLNKNAKKLEHGFEIYNGDEANPNFWDEFRKQVGKVDKGN